MSDTEPVHESSRRGPIHRRLILVRHGQTTANIAERIDTLLPGEPLTDEGWAQAGELAENLADGDSDVVRSAGDPVTAIYHSEAVRARDTASVLARRLGVPSRPAEGVHEVHGGDLEGCSDKDSRERYRDVCRLWARGEYEQAIPGGETGKQVLDRFVPTVDSLLAAHPGEVVLLVTHAAAMRLVAGNLARNLDGDFAMNHYLQNCSAIVLVEDDRGWRCTRWHDVDVP